MQFVRFAKSRAQVLCAAAAAGMLLWPAASAVHAQSGRVTVNRSVTIVESTGEPGAVQRALDTTEQAMAAAEYGKWKNWYRGDWLDGVRYTRRIVQDYANHLRDRMAPLPAPMEWSGWDGYFHIMEYEGNRSADVK